MFHLLSNRFLASWRHEACVADFEEDSDLAFLHYQERKLRHNAKGAEGWANAYYMPGGIGSGFSLRPVRRVGSEHRGMAAVALQGM